MGRLDLVPTKIGDYFGADRANDYIRKQCEHKSRIHQKLLPFSFGRVVLEVELLHIHRALSYITYHDEHNDLYWITKVSSPGPTLSNMYNYIQ